VRARIEPTATRSHSANRAARLAAGEARADTVVESALEGVPEAAPRAERGHLSLDTVPYSVVFLNGQRLGITPLEVDLVAKTHTLVLRNPEQGTETSYQVTIRSGASLERRVALD